jgi:hypothetical protein
MKSPFQGLKHHVFVSLQFCKSNLKLTKVKGILIVAPSSVGYKVENLTKEKEQQR